MEVFIKVGYENGFKVELYTELYDYDVMGMSNNDNLHRINVNMNEPDYVGEEYDEDPENIDFYVDEKHDVMLEKLSINDPFFNKTGRDIKLGRCAGRRGMNKKKEGVVESDNVNGKKAAEASDKVKGKKAAEASDKVKGKKVEKDSPKKPVKWTRMMVLEHRGHHCPFRLWASWTSSEREVRESSKKGGRSFSRGKGTASMSRGSTSMDRGTESMGRSSTSMGRGTASKRGRFATMGRGSASKKGGSATMGRGSARSSQSKRGGSTTMGRGSQSKRGGSTGSISIGRGSQSMKGGSDRSTTMGRGCCNKRGGSVRKWCDDSNNTEVTYFLIYAFL
nr:hypothetical protein [Tanacetum cinerariifolium]